MPREDRETPVVVPIIVTPANGIAVDLIVEFVDPAVLQVTDVLKTTISTDFELTFTPDNVGGTILISLFGALPAMSGTGSLLDVEFSVIWCRGLIQSAGDHFRGDR